METLRALDFFWRCLRLIRPKLLVERREEPEGVRGERVGGGHSASKEEDMVCLFIYR